MLRVYCSLPVRSSTLIRSTTKGFPSNLSRWSRKFPGNQSNSVIYGTSDSVDISRQHRLRPWTSLKSDLLFASSAPQTRSTRLFSTGSSSAQKASDPVAPDDDLTAPRLRLTSSVFVAPHPHKRDDPSAVPLGAAAPLTPSPLQYTPDGVFIYRALDSADMFECVRHATVIGYIDREKHAVLAQPPVAEVVVSAIGGDVGKDVDATLASTAAAASLPSTSTSTPASAAAASATLSPSTTTAVNDTVTNPTSTTAPHATNSDTTNSNTTTADTSDVFATADSLPTPLPFPPPSPPNACDVGGEDAYVVLSGRARALHTPSCARTRPYSMVAIADGVSSWRHTHGVDSGLFARSLVAHARDAACVSASEGDCSSGRVFWSAVDGCLQDGVIGSATLTVGTLCERRGKTVLDITRVGDCSVIVLRPQHYRGRRFFEVVYRSKPQVLALDTPVQVSCVHASPARSERGHADVDADVEDVDAIFDLGVVNAAAADEIRAVYPSFRHTGTLVAVGTPPPASVDATHPRYALSLDGAQIPIPDSGETVEEILPARTLPFEAIHNTVMAPVRTPVPLPQAPELMDRYPDVRALRARVRVDEGDVVIWGSDGLFDNVFDGDLVKTVTECANEYYAKHINCGNAVGLAELMAARVGDVCVERSVDHRTDTPYAVAAQDDFVLWSGGRLDDVCIVVSVVNKPED